MRVLLFTGKGGVGKTTMAAATAAEIAATGRKTLVISADAAHSLGDALALEVSTGPVEISSSLYVAHIDTQLRLQNVWGAVQSYLVDALGSAGIDSVRAEEVTVLPGAEELLTLIEVREHLLSGTWEAVVVDCAPTAETLRLLALPEVLTWYMSRMLPPSFQAVRALRPVLGPAFGLPTPRPEVWVAAERLQQMLRDVQDVLRRPETTVRLVLTPEAVVVSESRRTLTQLALHGFQVDGVIANRVIDGGTDPWRAEWARNHERVMREVASSFQPLPIWRAAYRSAEPIGIEALQTVGKELYASGDPLEDAKTDFAVTTWRDGEEYVMSLHLPFVEKRSLDLTRVGEELIVTVGGRKRLLAMPAALRRCRVKNARIAGEQVLVTFELDPSLAPVDGVGR